MGNAQVDRIHAKLGNRLAMLVSMAIVHTVHKLHHVKHRLAMAVFHSISDMISDEVDVTLGPVLSKLHASLPEDHPAYPAVDFMLNGKGQLKALVGTGLQVSGLLGSLSAILNNELAPAVYDAIATNPHMLPDASTILQLHAAGLIDTASADAAMRSLGTPSGWTSAMMNLANTYPSIPEGLEMMRRGFATSDNVAEWAGLSGVPESIVGKYLGLLNTPVSVADAALAVLRGNMTQAEGEKVAAENGFTPESFAVLIGNTGEPPGLMQLLEAYRRGFIDQATLERGILQSRYRNEWIPMLEKLRYVPMSTSDAARAVVQDQMQLADGAKIADENGLDPGAFQVLVNTEGNPLSRTEMSELFNRGIVSEAQFNQAMRESRLKNKYNDLAFALRTRLLPEGTISRAVRYGEITHSDAVAKVVELGYSASDAETIVATGSGERLYAFKEKVVSSVTTLYQDGIIALSDAGSLIKSLGYSDQEITYLLEATEFHREAHVINTVVSAIKSKFLQHHITSKQASGLLDSVGIPASNRDYLINLWEIEQAAFVRVLTPAQIVKAVNNDLITADEGLKRLVALGYVSADAQLLIEGA